MNNEVHAAFFFKGGSGSKFIVNREEEIRMKKNNKLNSERAPPAR